MTEPKFSCNLRCMGTLIRSDLTPNEYAELRKRAIDKGQRIGAFVGDTLRKAHKLPPDKQRRGKQ